MLFNEKLLGAKLNFNHKVKAKDEFNYRAIGNLEEN